MLQGRRYGAYQLRSLPVLENVPDGEQLETEKQADHGASSRAECFTPDVRVGIELGVLQYAVGQKFRTRVALAVSHKALQAGQ